MNTERGGSIKTIDVISPPPEDNYASFSGLVSIRHGDLEKPFMETCTTVANKPLYEHSIFRFVIKLLKAYTKIQKYSFRTSNAVRDVKEPREYVRSFFNDFVSSSVGFASLPSATLNVTDKKYSEVFQEIFNLRHPEDSDDPLPSELAYWNALKTLASAYNILRGEHPRSAQLDRPTAVVDNSGGVRLVWKTPSKQVKAIFAGGPEQKSYIYYESGQVYDTEALDANTLARRLGWIV